MWGPARLYWYFPLVVNSSIDTFDAPIFHTYLALAFVILVSLEQHYRIISSACIAED